LQRFDILDFSPDILSREVDAALPLLLYLTGECGLSVESDTAFEFVGEQLGIGNVGISSETDTPFALVPLVSADYGLAVETDIALIPDAGIGLSLEIDVALTPTSNAVSNTLLNVALNGSKVRRLKLYPSVSCTISLTVYRNDGDTAPIYVSDASFISSDPNYEYIVMGQPFTVGDYTDSFEFSIVGYVDGRLMTLVKGSADIVGLQPFVRPRNDYGWSQWTSQ
jgi:hypothetical protein